MLIENFSFGNFRSFKDIQSLNMNAADIVSANTDIDKNNVIYSDSFDALLKSKAIYGANASGKSNIVKALYTFIFIIRNSVENKDMLLSINEFKLSEETANSPTFFQIIFIHKNIRYRYGFEATAQEIKSEWLFYTPHKEELNLFIRENDKIIEINKKEFEEGYKVLDILRNAENENQIYRKDSLFLSTLVSLGLGKISKSVSEAITSIIIIEGLTLTSNLLYNIAKGSLNNKDIKEYTNKMLKISDVGIDEVISKKMNLSIKESISPSLDIETQKSLMQFIDANENEEFVFFSSKKYDKNSVEIGSERFSLDTSASEGTKKIFELSPLIYNSLRKGVPLIIDEFDARFHPLLTKKIVELFNSAENTNAQLIFITHDTNLLSNQLLRTDQIDFVEKDKFGASHLYTLVELEGVTSSDSFESDYIRGKYGAIPFLGDFNKLIYSTKKTSKDA